VAALSQKSPLYSGLFSCLLCSKAKAACGLT
jgi:hypothetical protein